LVAGHVLFKQILPQAKAVAPSAEAPAPVMAIPSTPQSALPALAAHRIAQTQRVDRNLRLGDAMKIVSEARSGEGIPKGSLPAK